MINLKNNLWTVIIIESCVIPNGIRGLTDFTPVVFDCMALSSDSKKTKKQKNLPSTPEFPR